jgi:hypothetical protein
MKRILLNLIPLALVLGLFLPAGWCCRPADAQVAQHAVVQSPAAHGCCGKTSTSRSAERPGVPVAPVRVCCCATDLVIPPVKVRVPEFTVSLAAALNDAVLYRESNGLPAATESPQGAGPPLRVLQCVWRC